MTTKSEVVDLEDFFFFICDNPIPYETHKNYRKSDEKKTQIDIDRQYENNLIWKKNILKKLLEQTSRTNLLIRINMNWGYHKDEYKEQTGLDAWL